MLLSTIITLGYERKYTLWRIAGTARIRKEDEKRGRESWYRLWLVMSATLVSCRQFLSFFYDPERYWSIARRGNNDKQMRRRGKEVDTAFVSVLVGKKWRHTVIVVDKGTQMVKKLPTTTQFGRTWKRAEEHWFLWSNSCGVSLLAASFCFCMWLQSPKACLGSFSGVSHYSKHLQSTPRGVQLSSVAWERCATLNCIFNCI